LGDQSIKDKPRKQPCSRQINESGANQIIQKKSYGVEIGPLSVQIA